MSTHGGKMEEEGADQLYEGIDFTIIPSDELSADQADEVRW